MSKPTEAESMLALEQLDEWARERVLRWALDRWPRAGTDGHPAPIQASTPIGDEAEAAERALAIAEAVAAFGENNAGRVSDDVGLGYSFDVIERDLTKPPDQQPGWIRRPEGWERWEATSNPRCEHANTKVVQGMEHCLDCTGVLVRRVELVEDGDGHDAAAFAIRGTPIQSAMPFESLTVAHAERQGVLESPHVVPGESEAAQTGARNDAHLGVFAGDSGVFSDGAARTLERAEDVMAGLEMAPVDSFDKLPRLLRLMPSWKVLLHAPYEVWRFMAADYRLVSRWTRSVDREQLLSLLEQTPLAAMSAAVNKLDPSKSVGSLESYRRACDALTWLWLDAYGVVHVDAPDIIRRAYHARLDEEATALVAALRDPARSAQALETFAVAGTLAQGHMLTAMGDESRWDRPDLQTYHKLLGLVVIAHAQARVGGALALEIDWLDRLENARQRGRVDEAVQAIVAAGAQEALLRVQPADISDTLELEAWTSASPIVSPILLNRHCYPWWLSTVQKALREQLAAHANGASETAQA
jgi:hypothetical protein